MSKTETPTKITPADLEGKLRAFQGDIQSKVDSQKTNLLMVGGVVVGVMLVIFFLLGKRSGKKRTTLVEIRRV
jgi:hypothetical protein